jgi:hypothetical protein
MRYHHKGQAVVDFTHRAAVLSGDPGGLVAFLGDVAIVNDKNPVLTRQRPRQQFFMS